MTEGTKGRVPKVTNEKMKQILTLYNMGITSPKLIAQKTGINYNTVKEYIRRARKKGLIKALPEVDIVEKHLYYIFRLVEERYVKNKVYGERDKLIEELYFELEYILRAYKTARKAMEYIS